MSHSDAVPRTSDDTAWSQRWRALAIGGAVSLVILLVVAVSAIWVLGRPIVFESVAQVALSPEVDTADVEAARRLARRLERLRPRGVYVVVDSYGNRLRVYEGGRLLREAVCSAGSGTVLIDPSGRRRWTFDTPLGVRRVERKVRDPVWSKPDWAFIEEGYQPPTDPGLRVDTVSLGDFALYLGDGFIIHGTLFQTLLGRGITHGCIRLGDEDLEHVYQTVPVGAPVYLY